MAIRPRGRLESIDLGFAFARAHWEAVWTAWAVGVLPPVLLLIIIGYWYPGWAALCIWWLKPLYDRIALWVLSRAVFGAGVRAWDLRRALPDILWRTELLRDLTYRRINVQRSFNLPVSQLERQHGGARRERLRLLHAGSLYAAQGLTLAAVNFELLLYLTLIGLVLMMLPPEVDIALTDLFLQDSSRWLPALSNLLYVVAMTIIEPFYVAGGFALYLNRRTWLEGWDLELAFRRAAARLSNNGASAVPRRAA